MTHQLTPREAELVRHEIEKMNRAMKAGMMPRNAWKRHSNHFIRLFGRIQIDDGTGCWNWCGSISKGSIGYGQLRVGNEVVYAHRFFRELFHGRIPDGLNVRHTCDNPRCCCPEHLDIGTQAQNVQDMVERGRSRGSLKPVEALLAVFLTTGPSGAESEVEEVAAEMGVSAFSIQQIRGGKRHAAVTGIEPVRRMT